MSQHKRTDKRKARRSDRRIRIHGVQFDPPQAKKIAEVVVLLAAQAEVDAEAEHRKHQRQKPREGAQ
jgi:hypothetical protein